MRRFGYQKAKSPANTVVPGIFNMSSVDVINFPPMVFS